MINFYGKEIEPGEVVIEVRWHKPILDGVEQELGVWKKDFRITSQDLADHASELLEGSPWEHSEYRIQTR